jgi:copper chaperone NosL
MRKVLIVFSFLTLLVSCTVAPEKIEYGKDACSFCDMTIVDKTHAAEYVTKKGRSYKFDAIECLINDLKDKDENEMAFILVSDLLAPTELINANEATYLISEELKSPMGANLSAFKNKEVIHYKGNVYNWKDIKVQIRK